MFSTHLIESISADEIYVNNINIEDQLNEIQNNILDLSNNFININIDFSQNVLDLSANQLSLENILNGVIEDISSNLNKIFDISQNVLENEIKISDINDLIYKDSSNNTIIKRDNTKEIRFYDLSSNYKVAIDNSGDLYVKHIFTDVSGSEVSVFYNVNERLHYLLLQYLASSKTIDFLQTQILVEIPLLIAEEYAPLEVQITARESAFNKKYPLHLKQPFGLELLPTLELLYDSNQFQLNTNNELQVRGNVDFQTLNTEIFSREIGFYKQYPLYLRPKTGEEFQDTLKLLYNSTQFELNVNNELQIKNSQDLKTLILNKGNLDPSGNSLTLYYNNNGAYFTDNSFNSFVNLNTSVITNTGLNTQPFITVYNRMFKNGINTAVKIKSYGLANANVNSSTEILLDSGSNPSPGTNIGNIYIRISDTDKLLISRDYTQFYNNVNMENLLTAKIGIDISGNNVINFGSNLTKQANAGKIGYNVDRLTIVGGGTDTINRLVYIYDKLEVINTVTATSFIGSGASLTSLNASNITGIIPVLNGGTGVTTSTGTGSTVLSVSPTITGTLNVDNFRLGDIAGTKTMSFAPGAVFKVDFANNAGGAFIINSVGNVGIGKSSPTTKLDVNGTLNAGATTLGTLNATTTTLTNTTINGTFNFTGSSPVLKKRFLYNGGLINPIINIVFGVTSYYYQFDLSSIPLSLGGSNNRVLTFNCWGDSADWGDANEFTLKYDVFISSYAGLKYRLYKIYAQGNNVDLIVINATTLTITMNNYKPFYCYIEYM